MRKKSKTAPTGQSMVKGAAILASSVIIVKIIGFVYKLLIGRMLGGLGLGYFGTAYDLYGPIESLANAGFPVAISKLVSDYMARGRYRDIRKLHKLSIPIFIFTGSLAFLIMVGFSFPYVWISKSPGALYATLFLSPTVFFVCMMSIYKGYYQGLGNMLPTAKTEIIEALSKLIVGFVSVIAVFNFVKKFFGISGSQKVSENSDAMQYVASSAIFGVTFGALMAFLYIFFFHKKNGDGITKEQLKSSPTPFSLKQIFISLIKLSIPIGLAALVMNIGGVIDAVIVKRRLEELMENSSTAQIILNMYTNDIATEIIVKKQVNLYLYGCMGYVTTFTLLVPSITQMLGVSALPKVAAAWVKKDKIMLKQSVETVIRLTSIVAIPAGIAFIAMGGNILELVYGDTKICEVHIASKLSIILSLAMVFVSFSTPIFSMLQAVGLAKLPLKLLIFGVTIKIICNYILVGIPAINIQGAGTGTLICYIFVTTAAFYRLCKRTRVFPNFVVVFVKPIIAAFVSVMLSKILQRFLSCFIPFKINVLITLCIIVILYFVLLLLFGGILKSDIKSFPKGEKIVKVLEKIKWIR